MEKEKKKVKKKYVCERADGWQENVGTGCLLGFCETMREDGCMYTGSSRWATRMSTRMNVK
jgi:hypothetical protein